jgi:hypothetical protein
VGDERAHAEFLGQGDGLTVVCCGLIDLRGIAVCRNVAEKVQGICLIATFLVGTRQLQGTPGQLGGLVQTAG